MEREKVSEILAQIEGKLRSQNKFRNAGVLTVIRGMRTSVVSDTGSFRLFGSLQLRDVRMVQTRMFRTRRGETFGGLQFSRPAEQESATQQHEPASLPPPADKRAAGERATRTEAEPPKTPYLRFVHAAGQTTRLVTNVAMAWLVLYFCYLVLEWTGRVGQSKETSSSASGSFSKSIGPLTFNTNNVKEFTPELVNVTLDDVRGCDEVKRELADVVSFLKEPQRFTKMGAKLPRGILLVGSPGTGKTLIARAIAGEANVPFFFAAGSEFDEVFVGTGAKRIRQLFGKFLSFFFSFLRTLWNN